jgi:hypothetical protein
MLVELLEGCRITPFFPTSVLKTTMSTLSLLIPLLPVVSVIALRAYLVSQSTLMQTQFVDG